MGLLRLHLTFHKQGAVEGSLTRLLCLLRGRKDQLLGKLSAPILTQQNVLIAEGKSGIHLDLLHHRQRLSLTN